MIKHLTLNNKDYTQAKKHLLINLVSDKEIKNKLKEKTHESSLFLYYIEILMSYQETGDIYYYRKLIKLIKNPKEVYSLLNFYYNLENMYKYNKEEKRWYKYDNKEWKKIDSLLVEIDLDNFCKAFFNYPLYTKRCLSKQLLRQLKININGFESL